MVGAGGVCACSFEITCQNLAPIWLLRPRACGTGQVGPAGEGDGRTDRWLTDSLATGVASWISSLVTGKAGTAGGQTDRSDGGQTQANGEAAGMGIKRRKIDARR